MVSCACALQAIQTACGPSPVSWRGRSKKVAGMRVRGDRQRLASSAVVATFILGNPPAIGENGSLAIRDSLSNRQQLIMSIVEWIDRVIRQTRLSTARL
jgi:hypothetical protein